MGAEKVVVRRATCLPPARSAIVVMLLPVLLAFAGSSGAAPGEIRTVVGGPGQGPGISVAQQPWRLATFGTSVFVADVEHDVIRRFDTLTGDEVVVAGSGIQGFAGDGGPATAARLLNPYDVAVDAQGDLFIADVNNQRIRRVTAATGVISTIVGTGVRGSAGDGGPATLAQLNFPWGVAVDGEGNVFVAEAGSSRIRRVDGVTGAIATVVGTGVSGFGGDGGPAAAALLFGPLDVAFDRFGDLFIADDGNRRVRRVDVSTGIISTVAGTGTTGAAGDGGVAVDAQLSGAYQIAVDDTETLYIADTNNHRIRRVDGTTGIITTVAGTGTAGFAGDGGLAQAAMLRRPSGVAVDDNGSVFVADSDNRRVRCVDAASEMIATVAGNGTLHFGGDGGLATAAQLGSVTRLAVDPLGNLLIADTDNHRVRRLDVATGVVTTVAGTGVPGFSGDGGPATQAMLSRPIGMALDLAGNLLIADAGNRRIRRLEATSGLLTTIAGVGTPGSSGDGGPASTAELVEPHDVAVDRAGNIFIVDSWAQRVRRIDAVTGIITAAAGIFAQGFSGDGGLATDALMSYPESIAVDGASNLLIVDTGNMRLRRVDASTRVIDTIAGSGLQGFAGDGGPATAAAFYLPYGIALDHLGNVFLADQVNERIRRIDVVTGVVTTVAGSGIAGFGGDGGPATGAQLALPNGVVIDPSGGLLIADTQNRRVRRVESPAGCGNGVVEPDEECDDGNGVAHDGCSAICILEPCVAAPIPNCLVAAKAQLQSNEKTAGKEKLKLQWKKVETATTQGGFGDPVNGTARVALCLYDDNDKLIRGFVVDQGGQPCGEKACWSAKGTKGYGYKNKIAVADGISKIGYSGGDAGRGKADAAGANNASKGQTALPTGVVAALSGNMHPTIQLVTNGGFCLGATMTEVTRDDGLQYKARKK